MVPRSSSARMISVRSRGRPWATAIRMTSSHWSSSACAASSPTPPSSRAALAPRKSWKVRWTNSTVSSVGARSSPVRSRKCWYTCGASPRTRATGTAGSAPEIRPSARERSISVRPLRISQWASRWSNWSWGSSARSGSRRPRSRSRRCTSIDSAAAYSSFRPVGRKPRRSRCRAQIRPHSSGLVARRARSGLVYTEASNRSAYPSGALAAVCQRSMKARTFARLIGARVTSVKSSPASQSGLTAEGREVTSQRLPG